MSTNDSWTTDRSLCPPADTAGSTSWPRTKHTTLTQLVPLSFIANVLYFVFLLVGFAFARPFLIWTPSQWTASFCLPWTFLSMPRCTSLSAPRRTMRYIWQYLTDFRPSLGHSVWSSQLRETPSHGQISFPTCVLSCTSSASRALFWESDTTEEKKSLCASTGDSAGTGGGSYAALLLNRILDDGWSLLCRSTNDVQAPSLISNKSTKQRHKAVCHGNVFWPVFFWKGIAARKQWHDWWDRNGR